MRVAVVGAGVSGLTCGMRLLEERARVTIVAREPPERTTSAVAGAVWFPYRVRPNERTGPWGARGYARFERMAADPALPVSMVDMTILYPHRLDEEPWWAASVPADAVRPCTDAELPGGYADGRTVRVPCIEAPSYLTWLSGRFAELGGSVHVREIDRFEALDADAV